MANLSITTSCNLECSYCFAKSISLNKEIMDRSLFNRSLDFLERSQIKQVRMLGGEPTLHPDLDWFIKQSIKRGFQVLLFSNGIIVDSVIDRLRLYSINEFSILLNITNYNDLKDDKKELYHHILIKLNNSIILGYNIYNVNINLIFLVQLINQYHLKRSIRLGIAHPLLGGENTYLHPKEYQKVGTKIRRLFKLAEKENIHINFDCGFVPCMFNGDFNIQLVQKNKNIYNSCGPIPDILPDGRIISCFPLSSRKTFYLDDTSNSHQIKNKIVSEFQCYRTIGIFSECSSCSLKKNAICSGGCLSAAMLRVRSKGKIGVTE